MNTDFNRNPLGKGGFGDHPENINRKGVPRKPEIQKFREALEKVETEKGMDLLEHAIRTAFEDKTVLIAVIKKILPDLSAVDVESFTLADLMDVLRTGMTGPKQEEAIECPSEEATNGPSDTVSM